MWDEDGLIGNRVICSNCGQVGYEMGGLVLTAEEYEVAQEETNQ